ncbi:MAG: DUF58 domain-containing protein [Ignavibacteriota bacterium]|nr:DUF58 domain-containing protein [Ignavibacteriales bacterium]MBL1121645.1 DUF58 domain-containing protein [Ignavibacteriota bacterium]MCC7094829.1 DUF58 domain-containing protein [Ignavibacteriaceae bacterium]MCZ7613131.1 DUF58 domain-containing protein [Ignavibacteriaceae bacterium]QKJ97327.1 MAG: DUF58 domain-containing protein [Ignavibacteriota bacterium]
MDKPVQDFKNYLHPSFISKLNSLELKARLVVEGFMVGLHKSPYHGFSVEFSEHRAYMQGDNLKDVDWKVFGKTEKYFIKQYEEETNLRSYIFLDTSNSMAYSSEKNISKLNYSITLAAALSYLMIHQQDAVGLTLYSEKINKFLPPKSSRAYLQEILKSLINVIPSEKTNTAESLSEGAEKLKRRGLVVIISDFFDDINSVLKALKHFSYKKNEVIVFQILDPMEKTFAFGKDAIFKDLETGDELTTQPYQIQKAYREAMNEFTNKIKSECLNSNIDYNLIETSDPYDKALLRYIQKREKLF